MTPMDDFEQTLAAWLRGVAPDQAPDRVLDGALQRASQQPQRRGWLGWLDGGTGLGPVVRVAAVAAVIAVAAAVGLQFANLTPGPGGSPSSPPSPTTIPTPADCINRPVDILSIINQSDPVACYGDASLTADVFLTGGGAIDGPCVYVEPRWLACGSWVTLYEVSETATGPSIVLAATSRGPFLFAAIHPAAGTYGELLDQWAGTNVRVTGHFDDPAAQSCRYVEGSGFPREEFTAASLIEGCRAMFVVTSVAPN